MGHPFGGREHQAPFRLHMPLVHLAVRNPRCSIYHVCTSPLPTDAEDGDPYRLGVPKAFTFSPESRQGWQISGITEVELEALSRT
jgi:hypothetical protein